MRKHCLFFLCSLTLLCTRVRAQKSGTYETLRDLSYRPAATDVYAKERCKLDFRDPIDSTRCPPTAWPG